MEKIRLLLQLFGNILMRASRNKITFAKPSLNLNTKSANAPGTKMCSLQLKVS